MNEAEAKFNSQSMDAQVWAKEFMRIYTEQIAKGNNLWIDEALMIGWFANAIMAGYDEANRRNEQSHLDGVYCDVICLEKRAKELRE
jgi:hypothetical protein